MCVAHKKTPTNMSRIGNALIGRFRFGLDQKIIKEKTITILV